MGGGTDTEQNEIHDRAIDGLNAVRNSIIFGISPGGGAAFVHASKALDFLSLNNQEEQIGVNILKKALREPLRKIVNNSKHSGDFYLQQVLNSNNFSDGIHYLREINICIFSNFVRIFGGRRECGGPF